MNGSKAARLYRLSARDAAERGALLRRRSDARAEGGRALPEPAAADGRRGGQQDPLHLPVYRRRRLEAADQARLEVAPGPPPLPALPPTFASRPDLCATTPDPCTGSRDLCTG